VIAPNDSSFGSIFDRPLTERHHKTIGHGWRSKERWSKREVQRSMEYPITLITHAKKMQWSQGIIETPFEELRKMIQSHERAS